MINISTNKNSSISKAITKIISLICTLKFEYETSLSTQQKEWLNQSLVLLKKVLAEAVR
jgi:hypothetical protein